MSPVLPGAQGYTLLGHRSQRAAAAAAVHLAGPAILTKTKTSMPDERDVLGEEPRVGVFICKCGINIAGVIDVDEWKTIPKASQCGLYG
jgi:hypothetical protein